MIRPSSRTTRWRTRLSVMIDSVASTPSSELTQITFSVMMFFTGVLLELCPSKTTLRA